MRLFITLLLVLLLSACVAPPPPPPPPPVTAAPAAVPASWQELPGWEQSDPVPSLQVFRAGCASLRWREGWRQACTAAESVATDDPLAVRFFFEDWFRPWRLQQEDGSGEGLLTGYYVPDLEASRARDETYRYPLYKVPDDLLVIDLREVYPELANYRLRGRLDGRRVVPYWNRGSIDNGEQPLAGQELFWVKDPVELFFLHIQGSGRLLLPDHQQVMVNYADQNGYPYRSIGKLLLERGAMTREQMSMQNIRRWAREHPEQVGSLLSENPSYVFFRELPPEVQSPPGAFGIPLTPEYSLAVDPRYIPLGAPVYLQTTLPGSDTPLERLMIAQDTGGAIKGPVRGDFFWGMGDAAGAQAGRMKQTVCFWLLLPDGVTPPGITLPGSG